ncbi:MgtC/SapB family protein [Novosphingobium sp. M1R2S20]|uniref:Protein MgtC n=1 Tax=Novosphingobium rhizovicinum TaxID=3228928 RepID=A0ABV3RBM9_9SPHN
MRLNAPVPVDAIDADLLSRLGFAAVVGMLLGLDREVRGHAAGLRTHGIVCVAAAAMTVSILSLYHQLDGDRMDPLRVFEGTGAFVGFIGAGLIVFSRGRVHNLTTAAHVWFTAVIGIACGAGQWPLVLTGSVISVALLTLLYFVERRWTLERRIGEPTTPEEREP